MFTAKKIKTLMDSEPFKPFRLYMSDGKTYDIMNHAAAFVLRDSVEVGIDIDPDGIAADVDRCAIIHIMRILDVQPAKRPRKKSAR